MSEIAIEIEKILIKLDDVITQAVDSGQDLSILVHHSEVVHTPYSALLIQSLNKQLMNRRPFLQAIAEVVSTTVGSSYRLMFYGSAVLPLRSPTTDRSIVSWASVVTDSAPRASCKFK